MHTKSHRATSKLAPAGRQGCASRRQLLSIQLQGGTAAVAAAVGTVANEAIADTAINEVKTAVISKEADTLQQQ